MSQGKRNYNMCGAVGQSALMATCTLLSMNDFIGMSLAYRFSPNRKMSRTEQHLFGLILFAAIFLFLFYSSATASAQKEEKKILILFPGQSDLAAYPLTEKDIKSALATGTEFRIEYMDCYRNSDQTHNRQLLDLYRHRCNGKRINFI